MGEHNRPVAIVTGGSRGIGRAVVERLATDGFDVSFAYQADEAAAEDVCATAASAGTRVCCYKADVRDFEAVKRFVSESEDALGPVEALVTSAGIVRDNPLVLMSPEDWRDVRDVNLDGTFHACRAAVFSMMKRRRGTIVTLSSVAGVRGNATQTNYSASKAGIIGLTLALAKEVGPYGIRANVVAPGFIDTDMTAALPDKVKATVLERISLGRMGTAQEVADLVAFLVSGRATYVTGQVLGVDGGIAL